MISFSVQMLCFYVEWEDTPKHSLSPPKLGEQSTFFLSSEIGLTTPPWSSELEPSCGPRTHLQSSRGSSQGWEERSHFSLTTPPLVTCTCGWVPCPLCRPPSPSVWVHWVVFFYPQVIWFSTVIFSPALSYLVFIEFIFPLLSVIFLYLSYLNFISCNPVSASRPFWMLNVLSLSWQLGSHGRI